MDELVRSAHKQLSEETHRLGVAYQRSVYEAALVYQRGLMAAQLKFEEQLNTVVNTMTDTLVKATSK